MDMFSESPSQFLMLLIPLAATVLMFVRRKTPRRFIGTGVGAALLAAAIYMLILVFIEGFGPLFAVGYTGTLVLYLPLCLAISGLLSIVSTLLKRRGRSHR